MSRFLKFIVHLVIFLAILDVLALAAPPFLGINTAIITDTGTSTNLSVGSVTYVQPVAVDELQVGDSILIQEGSSTYRYRIHSIDSSSGVFQVYDQTDVAAGESSVTLKNTAYKVVITVNYIGYLIIATQTMEGWIIIGLVILFLIILFILSELWRKDKGTGKGKSKAAAAEADDTAANDAPKSKKQLKKEMKQRMKEEERLDRVRAKQELEEATRQLKEENKARKKELKQKKKEARRRARTGGFIEDYNPIEEEIQEREAKASSIETAAEEASKLLKEEVAAVTADAVAAPEEPQISQEQKSLGDTKDVVIPKKAEPVKELQSAPKSDLPEPEAPAEAEEEPVEIKKMAIPIYSPEELLAKAQEAGESPKIIKDEKSGVTLFDYSDILFEEE